MIPKVSIILPVYNAEKTVSRMIDSIVLQSLSDWELICIDDGSTDKSGGILDAYAEQFPSIHVHHKSNGGISSARQEGVNCAKGEYIIHADADDWVEPNMLEEMVSEMDKCSSDVLITDYFCHSKDYTKVIRQKPSELSTVSVMRELFQHLHGSCWNKMVRRSVIASSVKFISGLNYCEDTLFWVQLFSNKNIRIDYLDKAFYHYVVNENSITQNYSYALYKQTVFFIEKLEEHYPTNNDKKDIIKRWKLNVKFAALYGAPCFSSEEYHNIYPECNKYIMQYNTSYLNRILMYLSTIPCLFLISAKLYRIKNIITGHQVYSSNATQ